jgi:hypothetical protein
VKRKTKAEKVAEARIDRAYRATCTGIQVSVFDIPKIFAHGFVRVAAGDDDAALAASVRAFVDTIRK